MRMKELFWLWSQSNPSKGCSTPELVFWQSLVLTPGQPNTATLREEGKWFVSLKTNGWCSELSLVSSQNGWFFPPSCLAGVRQVCAGLGQPEESMLLKDRVGLSAWSVATDLFTSVICSETLENPMKLCCWNTHRAGKEPEDKRGLSRATLWLCHNDITTNIIWSQPWPCSLWFCAVLVLLPSCFPCLFLLPNCRIQDFGGTACAWQHSTIFPDPHLLP